MTRVAVVGLGLIGGSAALALRAPGYDRDPEVLARARRRGIDAAATLAEAVENADVVITAVSTSETPALLREISSLAPKALLTDTASLKAPMIEAAHKLRSGVRFVGGHPMAGSHASGVEAASPWLFSGRAWILVPTARSDAASVAAVSELTRAAGARPLVLDAKHHDQLMTWISHLPHAVATALARSAARHAGRDATGVAGPGFLDTTRIAARRTELALELALADPEALAGAIDEVVEQLRSLTGVLRRGDQKALKALFEQAASFRRGFEKR